MNDNFYLEGDGRISLGDNIFRVYSGAAPTFIEGDVFKTIIPLSQQASGQVSDQVILQENDRTDEVLRFCKIPRSRNEIQCFLKMKSRSYVRENY